MSLMSNMKPLVAVCMITYNHEKYIYQAISGILAQKTSFQILLVIGDDCSTDNTRKICDEFAHEYKEIELLYAANNMGFMNNFIRTLNACNAKYVAICEGDDYWIDPFKLQKQVAYLDENPKYSLCFHNALIVFDDKSEKDKNFCIGYQDAQTFSTRNLILNDWICPTASILFKRESLPTLPVWASNVYNGDLFLQLMASINGDLVYLDEVMSVYRKNATNSLSLVKRRIGFFSDARIFLLRNFNNHTNYKYSLYVYCKIAVLNIKKLKMISISKLKSVFG